MAGKKKRKTKQRAIGATNLTKKANGPTTFNHVVATNAQQRFDIARGVANAHAKHTNRGLLTLPLEPTLADRFHALPTELRLHIFSFLMVQPVKWNLEHSTDCCLRDSVDSVVLPRIREFDWVAYRYRGYLTSQDTCVRCLTGHHHQRVPLWNREDPSLLVWQNPWRSEWAPEILNEFVCSDCWDMDLRPDEHPHAMKAFRAGVMKCLCARRKHLQVRLVCKRWSEEAGRVFYTNNTFAFENTRIFVSFATNLPQHWRALVSKLSIMAYDTDSGSHAGTTEAHLNRMLSAPEHHNTLAALWHPLRSFPALSSLQLDATFLTRIDCIQSMLRLGLRDLRKVRFTIRNRRGFCVQYNGGSRFIYPEFVQARVLVGGLAEVVSKAIKGQRSAWLKRKENIVTAAARERELLAGLLHPRPQDLPAEQFRLRRHKHWSDRLADGTVMVYYDEDIGEWDRLWDKFGSAKMPLHAYLPTVHIARDRKKPKKVEEVPVVATRVSHAMDEDLALDPPD